MTRGLPNLLTVLRLIAVPVMVACLVADAGAEHVWRWAAWIVFVVAAATDALDGYLARRWHAVSSFGKLADPLADKALVLGALVVLAAEVYNVLADEPALDEPKVERILKLVVNR